LKKTNIFIALIAASFGLLIGVTMNPVTVLAQFIQWNRDDVVPVVFVEPSIAGYVARGASALQGTWTRDKVVPLIQVKPGAVGGFVPVSGSQIGNTWSKDQVRPFVIVRPNTFGAFEPAN